MHNKKWIFPSVASIKTEIRARRKHIIGSHATVMPLVCENGSVNDRQVEELSHNLASKAVILWNKEETAAEEFCHRFFVLSFYALSSGKVGDESIDDVIQLAECLVRSRDVFITVLQKLIPANMLSELFSFTESYDDSYYCDANFEDAVLGSIAVYLGSLPDPTSP